MCFIYFSASKLANRAKPMPTICSSKIKHFKHEKYMTSIPPKKNRPQNLSYKFSASEKLSHHKCKQQWIFNVYANVRVCLYHNGCILAQLVSTFKLALNEFSKKPQVFQQQKSSAASLAMNHCCKPLLFHSLLPIHNVHVPCWPPHPYFVYV